jgi:N-acetylglucosamine-6-phosphate deacetylase
VTDATAATGMPDGEYGLGSQRVYKCMGCVRLATGSLAGSVLTMDQALRNFVAWGWIWPMPRIACRSTRPTIWANRTWPPAPGAWADIVVLNAELQPVAVFVEGEAIDLTTN